VSPAAGGPAGRTDTAGLWPATLALPECLAQGAAAGAALHPAPVGAPRALVLAGRGTAALAADVLALVAGPRLAGPVVRWSGGPPPGGLGPDTPVLLLAAGADQEETTVLAHEAGAAPRLVAARPGPLLALADAGAGVELTLAGPGRADLGALVGAGLGLLEAAELLDGGAAAARAAADWLAPRRDALAAPDGGPARALARGLERTVPLVVGEGPAALGARRWATAFQLSARSPALAADLADMVQHGVAGFGQAGDVTRQLVTLVTLRHREEPAPAARRLARLGQVLDEVVTDRLEVDSPAPDHLTAVLDLALLGDVVALLVAAREDLDPGPVPAVDELLGLFDA
jgi:glucose/mannose-6-phosphate isomerase